MITNPHVMPKIDTSNGIEMGIYSLGDLMPDPISGHLYSEKERMDQIRTLAKASEELGLDIFQLGESHQKYFVAQAHMVLLGAIAAATKKIKLSSAATIISTSDPVRVFENAATVDLISDGRMEVVAGRASRLGLFELLGYDPKDYEELFEEKLKLLLQINENERVTWEGKFRKPLKDAEVLPRPYQKNGLPIWRAVGGPPASAILAGAQGLPMSMTTLGGTSMYFQRSVEVYRSMAHKKGYDINEMPLTIAGFLYLDEDREKAFKDFYPYLNTGLKTSNGTGFDLKMYVQGKSSKNSLGVGDPDLLIEKIIHQYNLFGMQRYVGQIDFAGLPFDKVMNTLQLYAEKVIPAVKKYTKEHPVSFRVEEEEEE